MSAPDEVDLPRLTKQVGRALVRAAGDGWTLIRAEYRAAGRHIEVDVLVAGPDGRPLSIRPPAEVVEGLGRIREGMYQPGRGTWLRAVYEIEPPGAFTCDFEPDVEPVWRRVPPPIGFQDELRAHPRTDAHLPDWLRARAGLPPAPPPAEAAPPGPQQTDAAPAPGSGFAPPTHTPPAPAPPNPTQPHPGSASGPRPHPAQSPHHPGSPDTNGPRHPGPPQQPPGRHPGATGQNQRPPAPPGPTGQPPWPPAPPAQRPDFPRR